MIIQGVYNRLIQHFEIDMLHNGFSNLMSQHFNKWLKYDSIILNAELKNNKD